MHEFFPMFVTQVWQVTLLAVVVWVVTKTLCKRRPHLGHALWLLVLVKCIVPPVFSSSTSVYSWLLKDEKTIPIGIVDDDGPLPKESSEPAFVKGLFPEAPQNRVAELGPSVSFKITPTQKPQAAQTPTQSRVAKAFEVPITNVKPSSSVPKVASKPVASMPSEPKQAKATPLLAEVLAYVESWSWQHWVMFSWSMGSLLYFAVTLVRFMRFRKWILRQEMIECEDVEIHVNELAAQLKLRRKIRVRVIDAEFGPAIMGLFRPTIILPNSIVADQTAEQLEPILGHELLHLRRGDIYWSVLQVVACSLMWFHPLVWLASRNVTRESEKCCDEETIANFQCDRANYARVLVDILEQKSRLRIAPVVPGVRPADITSSRLERIMQSDNGTCRRTPRWIWALVVLIGVAVIPGAAVVQSQEQKVADSPNTLNPRVNIAQSNMATKPTQSLHRQTQIVKNQQRKRTQQAFSIPSQPATPPISSSAVTRLSPAVKQDPTARQVHEGQAFGGGRFKPVENISWEARILELVTDDSERKKILKELKAPIWRTEEATEQLANLKSNSVNVEVRFWIDRMKIADEFLEESALNASSKFPNWRFAEQQISLETYEKLSKNIDNRQDQPFTQPVVKSYYPESNADKLLSAQLFSPVVVGLNSISILDPDAANVKKLLHPEGAVVSGRIEMADEDSISFNGQLTINKLKASNGRKLPLKFANREIRIAVSTTNNALHDFAWDIPKDQVQVVRAEFEGMPQKQMIVFVKATQRAAKLPKDQGLTLSLLNTIKKELPSSPNQKAQHGEMKIELPTEPKSFVLVRTPILNLEDAKVEPTPISLSLQCGDTESVEGRSISTKIGLASNSSLTIEGEVDSQQISVETVQVTGKNFVFKNEKENSFNAKAGVGSITFQRKGPIEDTLKLSLQSGAKLQFAGVEFAADFIECFPDRIEANGNVSVDIPEISSRVSANKVVMNLESLTFDFDGKVVLKRDIDNNSVPMVLSGNHVAWSLVTGHLEVKASSPARSAGQSNSFSRPSSAGSTGFGSLVLQSQSVPSTRQPIRGGAQRWQTHSQPPPNPLNQIQPPQRFRSSQPSSER